MDNVNLYTAEVILRVFTGILFFAQGFDKLFRLGMKTVVHKLQGEAESLHVPNAFVWLIVAYTSIIEFTCGITLAFGLFRYWSLVLLGIDLLAVSFAFSYSQPMWDTKHVLKRMTLILLLLIAPAKWAVFALDNVLFKK